MACIMAQGRGQAGNRGVGQIGGRGSSGQAGVRGVSQTDGRGSVQGGGIGQIGGRGSSGQAGVRGAGQTHGRGSVQGGGQADYRVVRRGSSGQRGGQGSGLGSSDTNGLQSHARYDALMPSPTEGSDADDESSYHVASMRRGPASQVQVPEPMNREWIWIVDGEFSNQVTSTRIVGLNLKAMWSGPWESWRNVSNEDKTRLFERFKCYFQWEEKWNAQVSRVWEKCIARKFANMLTRVRDMAKATARKQGLQVQDDMHVLTDFKPQWIRTETWEQMIDTWNTPEWKAKSQRNTAVRRKATGGKHTLGSQTYATAKRKAAKIVGRELSHHEMWKQSHCRKGSRPLDKDPSGSRLLIDLEDVDLEDFDLEGDAQEENLEWVDDRAQETWVKYEGYFVKKHEKENIKQAKVDVELWSLAAGGKNKGKVYGLSNVTDPYMHGRQDPEIEKLNKVIDELVKEKEEEKERLNGIIEELVAEKEKDKAEKDAMLNRMANIEAILKVRL